MKAPAMLWHAATRITMDNLLYPCVQCNVREAIDHRHQVDYLHRVMFDCDQTCASCNPFPNQLRQLHALYEDVRAKIGHSQNHCQDHFETYSRVFGHPDFVQGMIDRGDCDPQKFWNFIDHTYNYESGTTDALLCQTMRLLLAAGCRPPNATMLRVVNAQFIECVTLLFDWGLVFSKDCWMAAIQSVVDYNRVDHNRAVDTNGLPPYDCEYLRELLRRTGFRPTIADTLDLHSFHFEYVFPAALVVVRDVLDIPVGEMGVAWRVLLNKIHSVSSIAVRRLVPLLVDLGCPLDAIDADGRAKLLDAVRQSMLFISSSGDHTVLAKIRDYLA